MNPTIDLTGQRFGRLVVARLAASSLNGSRRWYCRCDCGTEVIRYGLHLRHRGAHSCGCDRSIDLTGEHFGMLTVLAHAGHNKHLSRLWQCRCACGNELVRSTAVLRNGTSTRCIVCSGRIEPGEFANHAPVRALWAIRRICTALDAAEELACDVPPGDELDAVFAVIDRCQTALTPVLARLLTQVQALRAEAAL